MNWSRKMQPVKVSCRAGSADEETLPGGQGIRTAHSRHHRQRRQAGARERHQRHDRGDSSSELLERFPEEIGEMRGYIEKLIKETLRAVILDEGRRPDGREADGNPSHHL